MGRKQRAGHPDLWLHIMNRAVGRRAMFENDLDVRRFIKRLKTTVETGTLEIHAFVVMQTHFHLLARCVADKPSDAMHLLQAPYAQWFNRTRERDGPLHRGRYLAKPVESEVYRCRLISYIDANPVTARIVVHPARYPHGSARHYARPAGPAWLTRRWVEARVRTWSRSDHYDPSHYTDAFPIIDTPSGNDPVLADLRSASDDSLPLDFLLATTDQRRAQWLDDLARRADGTPALRPVVQVETAMDCVATAGFVSTRRRTTSPRTLATTLLLRTLAGATFSEIGRQLGCSHSAASRVHERARHRLSIDEAFRSAVADAMSCALRRTYGRWQNVQKVPGTF